MNEEQQFERMSKLSQTDAEQRASIMAIIDATTKPIKNWTISFIGIVTLIAICLLTFYLVTTEPTVSVTSATKDQSIETVYYFTNGNRNEDTFFENWSPFNLHVGVVKDQMLLKQFVTFLQASLPRTKEDYYNNWSGSDYSATDVLIMFRRWFGTSNKRIKYIYFS